MHLCSYDEFVTPSNAEYGALIYKNCHNLKMASILFKKAIVRTPGHSIVNGMTTSNLGKPDYNKVLQQHGKYIEVLKSCGLEVTIMSVEEKFPDATFIEDCIVLTEKCAIIAKLGIESRKGEEISVHKVLKNFYTNIAHIKEPGILEGGDVMRVNDHFYIGLTKRTNMAGAKQLIQILEKFGYACTTISIEKMLHLKSGVAYLGDNKLILAEELVSHQVFKEFDKIIIDDDESYAANCIRVNNYVIIPAGYNKSKNAIIEAGFKIKEVDVSEFRKIDGGISCLSLRFSR